MDTLEEFKLFHEKRVDKSLKELTSKVKQINTFDLVANTFYYNSLHDTAEYRDYRGDKNFFIPEVLSMLTLKNNFVSETSIDPYKLGEEFIQIQNLLSDYCASKQVLNYKPKNDGDLISRITADISRHEHTIRNPGHPLHHYQFCVEMFAPIDELIKQVFGFSIYESVKLRETFDDFLNEKYNIEVEKFDKRIDIHIQEINEYKKTGEIREDSLFDVDTMIEFYRRSTSENKQVIENYLLTELHFNFGDVMSFTAEELAEYSDVDVEATSKFLNTFSNDFPSLDKDAEVFPPVSILKSKPILRHDGRYLVPSFPLLSFCVIGFIESNLPRNKSLSKRYSNIKHDFILNKGLEYFKQILPSAEILPPNLYYGLGKDEAETDGMIIWDRVLIIIEAKGISISDKAKRGYELKMKDHIRNIIEKSYEQAKRTYNFILENENAEFRTKKRKKFTVKSSDFDDVIFVSLNLEPLGSWSMQVKATNEIGYFQPNHFPLIISLYDLVIFADIIDNPILFFQYIKKRKEFLSEGKFNVWEELDLFGHYIEGGLRVNHLKEMTERENVTVLHMDITTDKFNDYYMQEAGRRLGRISKPKIEINYDLNNLLLRLEKLKVPHRLKVALLLLEFNEVSHKKLFKLVKKIKKSFSKDKERHDCSIYSEDGGGIGITFMTSTDVPSLEEKLFKYCSFKMQQYNSEAWVGLGDTSINAKRYDIKTVFVALNGNIERISI